MCFFDSAAPTNSRFSIENFTFVCVFVKNSQTDPGSICGRSN